MTACLPCGTTPVLTVVRHNLGGEVLDVLCLAGADVNARDARGETALQVAAREGRTSLVKRLLEAADIDLEIAGVGTVVRPIEPIVIESKHPYANNTNDFTPVLVPGATRLVVTFDPASSTENQCDYVRLLKNNAGEGRQKLKSRNLFRKFSLPVLFFLTQFFSIPQRRSQGHFARGG